MTTNLDPGGAPAPAPASPVAASLYPAADPALAPAAAPAPAAEGEVTPPAEPNGEAAPPPADAPAPVYEFKFPEGFTPDEAAIGSFKEIAAKANLAPEAAQQMLDMYAQTVQSAQAAQVKAWNDLQSTWTKELDAVPDFATPQLKEQSLKTISSVIEEFGTPGLKEAFDMTGAGNNPHVVQFVLNVAKALVEGAPTPQGNPTGAAARGRSIGERLYG